MMPCVERQVPDVLFCFFFASVPDQDLADSEALFTSSPSVHYRSRLRFCPRSRLRCCPRFRSRSRIRTRRRSRLPFPSPGPGSFLGTMCVHRHRAVQNGAFGCPQPSLPVCRNVCVCKTAVVITGAKNKANKKQSKKKQRSCL